MELHKSTANAFIKYLLDHGYPEESIVTEWGDNKHRIDIAILDEDRAMPVAIYEIKGSQNADTINHGRQQLQGYMSYLGYPVEAGLVFSKDTSPYFEYVDMSRKVEEFKVNEDGQIVRISKSSESNELTPYEVLKNSAEPKIINLQKKRKERKLNTFSILSWIMAFLTLAILVLENFGIITFTTERMIVYGIVLVLVVLPFYSELKFGDLSLKREEKKDKEETK